VNRKHLLRIIGGNIRKIRLERGLTQEGFAELIGIHWKTLGYIEAGKRDFGASTLTMIMMRLKISSAVLLDGIAPLKPSEATLILNATARKRRPRLTSS
jgi:transcriptional regulator with XRE-family HTH domain